MEGRWIGACVCVRVCVSMRVCVCDFSSKLGPEGPCEKPKEGEKTEPLRKAAGNTETCAPPTTKTRTLLLLFLILLSPSFSLSLSPWSSCTQMCLHGPPPPAHQIPPHHPCSPKLNATAKVRENEGGRERECRSW